MKRTQSESESYVRDMIARRGWVSGGTENSRVTKAARRLKIELGLEETEPAKGFIRFTQIEATLNTPLKAYGSVSGWSTIFDSRGLIIVSRISSDAAALIVKAVNEHAALNDVANSVQKFKDAQSEYLKRESSSELFDTMCFAESCMFTALANLEAVRKEGK